MVLPELTTNQESGKLWVKPKIPFLHRRLRQKINHKPIRDLTEVAASFLKVVFIWFPYSKEGHIFVFQRA